VTSTSTGAPVGADADADGNRRRLARREGLRLLPATVAHSGTLRLDRLILAGLVSTTALGLYAAVATIVELIAWPLLVFADSRLGVWRQRHGRGQFSLRPVLLVAVGYSIVAVAVMATAMHYLVEPLLGPGFAAARPLVLPLALAAAVFGMSQLLVNALTAVHRPTWASVAEVVGLGVSVLAYVLLIRAFGALGAAYGSLIGYGACLALAGIFLARALRGTATPREASGAGQESW